MLHKYNGTNRIGALPDGVIQHIFSFLDMKLVIQTSLLSNRWRYLWKSTPTLSFHLPYCTIKQKLKRNAFSHFVYRVLLVRDTSTLQKFSLSCEDKLETDNICTWIIAALSRNVEEFHLCSDLDSPKILPSNLFTSNIKILSLEMREDMWIGLPKSIASAGRIKSLRLVKVRLPDGDSRGELILSCPVLEDLIIIDCGGIHLKLLNISTPLLRTIEFDNANTCATLICCPNLISLKCNGYIRKALSLKNLSALVSADISIYPYYGGDPYDDSDRAKELYAQCLTNVLGGIYNINSLTLQASFLKILTNHPDLLDRIPNLFQNLRFLLVKDWTGGVTVSAVASILKRFPHIETLIWEISQEEESSSENVEDSTVDTSCQGVFHYLKTIEIRNPLLVEDELMLIEYLLRRAIVLEEVIFKTPKADSLHRSRLTEFREKVIALPIASLSVLISFQFRE